MLAINDMQFAERAEIIWEKGTNRAAFWRGEVDKYGWVDMGSSFLPSDIIAAFLYAQLENLEKIQAKRLEIWDRYEQNLAPHASALEICLPYIPHYAFNNAHMFYITCSSLQQRSHIINAAKAKDIHPVFHYLSLHKSPYYHAVHDGRTLPHCERYTDTLLRLPLYYDLSLEEVDRICEVLLSA